jgi:hypothetical protein
MRAGIGALLLLWTTTLFASQPPSILVSYSFDDGLTDTGPDTFAVFQNASGHVRLSSQIRYSGYRSIELRDVAGDKDFPELQGYFPQRSTGELFFHFALLVANPDQTLNVALAGPQHFTLAKDGIAFWLKTTGGFLAHVSDGIPKRLFRVEPFVWYLVDVRYDVEHGSYDLTVRKEGVASPVVALTGQPNAANAPGSAVDKFSFVGSVYEDDSNVTFYVDDVVIGTDEKVVLGPFVAPGRRKLFIDRWREARELMVKNPTCPPVLSLADFGLKTAEVDGLRAKGLLAQAEALLGGEAATGEVPASLEPLRAWRATCAAMGSNPEAAAENFAALAAQHPDAPIFRISELMALVRAKKSEAAMRRWAELEPLLQHDVRFGMIAAIAGMASGDFTRAEQWLRKPAEEMADEAIAEQYYFVLLWKGDAPGAARFAEAAARRTNDAAWFERAGDALFLGGSPSQARGLYEEALRRDTTSYWATTKLSDVFFKLGDAANEAIYRQRMYGKLEE